VQRLRHDQLFGGLETRRERAVEQRYCASHPHKPIPNSAATSVEDRRSRHYERPEQGPHQKAPARDRKCL
jgi:hypothetical protein